MRDGFLGDAGGDDVRDAGVAGFDGHGAPVHASGFEPGARGGDGGGQLGGVMGGAAGEGFVVGEEEKRLSLRGGPAARKGFDQRGGEGGKLGGEGGGLGTEERRFRLLTESLVTSSPTERRDNFLRQLGHAFAFTRDKREHGHAELLRQRGGVHRVAVLLGHVRHVQPENRRVAQLDDLRGVVEVALQIRGVHDHDHQRRRGHVGEPVEEDVARDFLIERLGAEAVSARQVEDGDALRALERAFLALDGDACVVADLRAQAGERVEERGLPAVRVARQRDVELGGVGHRIQRKGAFTWPSPESAPPRACAG